MRVKLCNVPNAGIPHSEPWATQGEYIHIIHTESDSNKLKHSILYSLVLAVNIHKKMFIIQREGGSCSLIIIILITIQCL